MRGALKRCWHHESVCTYQMPRGLERERRGLSLLKSTFVRRASRRVDQQDRRAQPQPTVQILIAVGREWVRRRGGETSAE